MVIGLAHELFAKFKENLPHLAGALIILIVGWWLAGWVKGILRRVMVARHVDVTLTSFLSQLCYWLIIAVVVLAALQNAQVETTPFSAVLGASALAVGLALQNSLMDFAAGVMIILFRQFRVGDEIEAAGVKGVVEEISIFSTHLKTADNRKIIVTNSKILGSPIINASANATRRLDLVVSISYESNLKLAKQIVLTELQNDIRVLPNPAPTIAVDNLAESSVDVILRAWVATSDYQDVRSHLLEALKLRFDEAGIDIPYPQHEVRVKTDK
jgi:small conductance mechanosensitive channel